MRALVRQLGRGHRGAAMVEFALVLPIILLLAVGVWECGRIFDAWLVATNGAREGARWAALGNNKTAVETRVQEYLCSGYAKRLDPADCGAGATGEVKLGAITMLPETGGVAGGSVSVEVPVAVKVLIPGPLQLGNTITLTGRATMRLQADTKS